MARHIFDPRVAIVAVLAGCAGGSPPPSDARSPTADTSDALSVLRAEEPPSPLRVARRTVFRPAESCSQGPDVIRFEALAGLREEAFEIHACAPRRLAADVRYVGPGDTGRTARSFGSSTADAARCVGPSGGEAVGAATAADARGTSAPGRGSRGRTGEVRGRRATTAASEGAPSTAVDNARPMVALDSGDEACPAGTERIEIGQWVFRINRGTYFAAGDVLALEFWSLQPNDYAGVTFVLEQWALPADASEAEYDAYLAAHDAWELRYDAALRGEIDAGRRQAVDATASTIEPPPPAPDERRPPSPSTHAEWIPGYWVRGDVWVWSPGFYRVPESDVTAGLTSVAPTAPPPPRVETPPPQPAPSLVWTQGGYQWDGRAFVWVEGAWRAPDAPDKVWIPPRWTPSGNGFRLQPGGWSFSLGVQRGP